MPSDAPDRKKLDRWMGRLDDHSDATRDTAIKMIVEVARDEPRLADEAIGTLCDILRRQPDSGHSVIWPIYSELDERLVASKLELLRLIAAVSGEFRTGGNFAMLLFWRLLDSGAMSSKHPLIREIQSGATRYVASGNTEDRDTAFQIVDWCEDNLPSTSG